jgi:hypothetical protein
VKEHGNVLAGFRFLSLLTHVLPFTISPRPCRKQHPPESLLRFIGAGLQKRSRRRLLNKASRISMLHVPLRQSSFQVDADMFLRAQARLRTVASASLEHVLAKAEVFYGTVLDKGYKAATLSKQSLLALQIIVLFLLMPQQYVGQFYYLVKVAMELCKVDVLTTQFRSLDSMHKKLQSSSTKAKLSNLYYRLEREDDMPDMVKSLSVLSLSEMDYHDGTNGGIEIV